MKIKNIIFLVFATFTLHAMEKSVDLTLRREHRDLETIGNEITRVYNALIGMTMQDRLKKPDMYASLQADLEELKRKRDDAIKKTQDALEEFLSRLK